MVVFVHVTDNKIAFTTHAGGAWSLAAMLDGTAASLDPVSVAPLAGGRAVLVYRSATDQKSYFSIFDATQTPVWSAPQLLAGAATPAGPPLWRPAYAATTRSPHTPRGPTTYR